MKFKLRSLRPQFTLRDLFWLMLLTAVVICGYQERQTTLGRIARREAELKVEGQRQKLIATLLAKERIRLMDDEHEALLLSIKLKQQSRDLRLGLPVEIEKASP